jgi:predicted Fe-Mo cluster-binding NifX family protein
MKIAITSQSNNLSSEIDERFARCEYFLIVDTETLNYEVIENSAKDASGGAGMQAVKTISDKGVSAVITGNVGPNALTLLKEANIKVYLGSGKIKDAIEKFKKGELKELSSPTVGVHSGEQK